MGCLIECCKSYFLIINAISVYFLSFFFNFKWAFMNLPLCADAIQILILTAEKVCKNTSILSLKL